MITKFNFSIIPSVELFSFGVNSLALCTEYKTKLPGITLYLSLAQSTLESFQKALKRENANPLIKDQTECDLIRIDAYKALRNYCSSCLTRRKEGLPEAAQNLIDVIRKHGWSISLSGQKTRTGIINNVVSEIRTRCTAEVEKIGAADLVTELDTAEKAYETAVQNAINHVVEADEPVIANARPAFTKALKSLFQYLELQQMVEPKEDMAKLITAINELAVSSIATVKAGDTRDENVKKQIETEKQS